MLSSEDILAKCRGGAAPGIGLAGMTERLAEFGSQINGESSSAGSVIEAVSPTGESVKIKKPLHVRFRLEVDTVHRTARIVCIPRCLLR
jgi:hypothetical protein